MSEIFPNETVKLYQGIRLDPNYNNTLRWNSYAEQTDFFHSALTPVSILSNLSYQRVNKGVIRVQAEVGSLNNVNYMAFTNYNLNPKWFYAFVTKTEYVNNVTTDVFYEIDYLQSYYFNVAFGSCFVAREHVADDTRGANTIQEPITVNSIKAYSRVNKYFTDMMIFIYRTDETDGDFLVSVVGNSINGLGLFGHLASTTAQIESLGDWIIANTSDLESVVSMFPFPHALIGTAQTVNDVQYWPAGYSEQRIYFPSSIDGYTPRNNKLFTYPYCFLSVDNGEIANIYKYEDFQTGGQTIGNQMVFNISGHPTPNPQITCAPYAYKNCGDNNTEYTERLILSLPQIAFPIDSFKAWLAQTESTRQNKVIQSGLKGAAGGATTGMGVGSVVPGIGTLAGAVAGALIGGVSGALGGALSNAYAEAEAENLVNHVSGANQGSEMIAAGKFGFTFKYMGIRAEQAHVIDDFFTMFGYQVNRVKVPNIHTRERWNYLKTNGCNFTGSVPAEALTVLKRIHDNGITYWENHADIGNYSLSNSPV